MIGCNMLREIFIDTFAYSFLVLRCLSNVFGQNCMPLLVGYYDTLYFLDSKQVPIFS